MNRHLHLCGRFRAGGLLLLGGMLAAPVAAQDLVERYYVRARQPTQAEHVELLDTVRSLTAAGPAGARLVSDIFYPQFGVSAAIAMLTREQLNELSGRQYVVSEDFRLQPNDADSWPLNRWTPLPPAATAAGPGERPVVYLIDSGIRSGHSEFQYPPGEDTLVFLPGLSYGYNNEANPPTLLSPYQDVLDHGTRVAGCLGGHTTGLLGLLGGRAAVKSVGIYDSPPAAGTFVSQAIQGILGSVADHQARKAQPYLKNHASILVFAHSTSVATGRVADLDQAIDIAWKEGLQVVMSAGNDAAAAVLVSPAGAAWGYQSGGFNVRFWFGAPPAQAPFYRAADAFLVTGAYEPFLRNDWRLWPSSNHNLKGAEVLDLLSPGRGIPCASSAGQAAYAVGSGTSYAAGFTGAMAAWIAFECPWARPFQARQEIRQALAKPPALPMAQVTGLPESLSYQEWIEHFYPAVHFSEKERQPLGDPDGDGVVNFVEYHAGQDPRFRDAEVAPVITLNPGPGSSSIQVKIPLAHHLGSAPQVSWQLQISTDLKTWNPVPVGSGSPSPTGFKHTDGSVHQFNATGPPLPGPAFFRIRFFANGPLL